MDFRKPHLEKTIKVLLKRGADPNVSTVPMPALFFAVKSADTLAVQTFLAKNADTTSRIEKVFKLCFKFHVIFLVFINFT